MIRVAVVEDHPVVRRGVAQVVESHPGLELFAAAAGIEDLPGAGEQRPDVVLLDLHLRGLEGAAAVRHLTAQGLCVLVLTASESLDDVQAALEAGARGYVPKSADVSEILTAIEVVAQGHDYVSARLAGQYLRRLRAEPERGRALSARELQIVRLVAQGYTDKEIARRVNVSLHTVRTHLDRVREKLGVRRRSQIAVRIATEFRSAGE